VTRKYSRLYSNKVVKKSGRKSPDQTIVDLIINMKKCNPTIAYGRIAMQVYETFGIEISRFAVGRIMRKNSDKLPSDCRTVMTNLKKAQYTIKVLTLRALSRASRFGGKYYDNMQCNRSAFQTIYVN